MNSNSLLLWKSCPDPDNVRSQPLYGSPKSKFSETFYLDYSDKPKIINNIVTMLCFKFDCKVLTFCKFYSFLCNY